MMGPDNGILNKSSHGQPAVCLREIRSIDRLSQEGLPQNWGSGRFGCVSIAGSPALEKRKNKSKHSCSKLPENRKEG